jgi:hypothetical protein
MKPKFWTWLAIVFVFAMILYACGGGGGSSNNSNQTDPTGPLSVVSISSDGVGINEPIRVTFNKKMDASTINTSTFLISGVTGTVTYDPSPFYSPYYYSAYFTPSSYLAPSTKYTITITPTVKDISGNSLGGYYINSFTTSATTSSGSWQRMSNIPDVNFYRPGTWTGTDIIMIGIDNISKYNIGLKYNPQNDIWSNFTPPNDPQIADEILNGVLNTYIWTGSEIIVWGGTRSYDNNTYSNTGGIYEPSTDTWTATSLTNAPSARTGHTAIWTGTEMIVWGGQYGGANYLNTGARYNPVTDTWTATSVTNVPSQRSGHTAVWTGTEMIIWGGIDGTNALNTGARYNPVTDTWTATSVTNVPSQRSGHTAVWTGTEMIIWGGIDLNTGSRYNPSTDAWIATSVTDAPWPPSVVIWTGNDMIVFGNSFDYLYPSYNFCFGGRYTP